MKIRVINDTHLGVKRRGGTTDESREALRDFIWETFETLLSGDYDHLVVNGDLFDSFTVDSRDVARAFSELVQLVGGMGKSLTLVAGNHDWRPRAHEMSSFHLLTSTLDTIYRRSVFRVVDASTGYTEIARGVYVIPHMENQAAFDAQIQAALDVQEGGILLLHANYNNNFAEQSDHSLNVSQDVAARFASKGVTLVFAHEHQARKALNGNVIVVGNQIPTSVADMIGSPRKQFIEIEHGEISFHDVSLPEKVFVEQDWRAYVPDDAKFIRLVGEASGEEANAVTQALLNLRRKHNAFVITNAVRIEGGSSLDAMSELAGEAATGFNVVAALMEELNEREREVVRKLLEISE